MPHSFTPDSPLSPELSTPLSSLPATKESASKSSGLETDASGEAELQLVSSKRKFNDDSDEDVETDEITAHNDELRDNLSDTIDASRAYLYLVGVILDTRGLGQPDKTHELINKMEKAVEYMEEARDLMEEAGKANSDMEETPWYSENDNDIEDDSSPSMAARLDHGIAHASVALRIAYTVGLPGDDKLAEFTTHHMLASAYVLEVQEMNAAEGSN